MTTSNWLRRMLVALFSAAIHLGHVVAAQAHFTGALHDHPAGSWSPGAWEFLGACIVIGLTLGLARWLHFSGAFSTGKQ